MIKLDISNHKPLFTVFDSYINEFFTSTSVHHKARVWQFENEVLFGGKFKVEIQ